jgi:hypothetical protein
MLKAMASPGALVSTTSATCRKVSVHLALISGGLLSLNFSFRPSRAIPRPSAVPKSATTALMSSSALWFTLAFASSAPPAKLSWKTVPASQFDTGAVQRILANAFAFLRGSAAVMAQDLWHQPSVGIAVQACGDGHLMNFGAFATPY